MKKSIINQEDNKTFIIAELSANHNQDLSIAFKTIEAAKKSGADAIKLQTYTPDTITINSQKSCFKINNGSIWDGKNLYELYTESYTPWDWQPKLKKFAEEIGLSCFSTPFDISAVDFLEEINVPAYKIASFEINHIPLIEYVASKGKPIIISTGIATLADIEEAVNACKRMGNNNIALLKCTSAYPAPIDESNLRTIPHLKSTFRTTVGLSDHTLGCSAAIAAVALGAQIVEKHFILNRNIGGADASFSMEPDEFKFMTKSIREVESALGDICYDLSEGAMKNKIFSQSLFVVQNIKKGDLFTDQNIRSIRPGDGLHPRYLKEIIGCMASDNISKGTPLSWKHVC